MKRSIKNFSSGRIPGGNKRDGKRGCWGGGGGRLGNVTSAESVTSVSWHNEGATEGLPQ